MIEAIDEGLRRLLAVELPRVLPPESFGAVKVTFEPPTSANSGGSKSDAPASKGGEDPRLNLYLYDICENTRRRDFEPQVQRTKDPNLVAKKRGRVRVDLNYVVTAHAGDSASEHRILSAALGAFLRNEQMPEKYLENSDYETEAAISVAQPDDSFKSGNLELWQVLGGQIRASLQLVITALFDPFDSKEAKVVREALIAVGRMPSDPQGRPQDVRSYRVSFAGLVLDGARSPLAFAQVCVLGTNLSTTTDERGFFHLDDSPPGTQRLIADCRGYKPMEITAVPTRPGLVNELEPLVFQLEPLLDSDLGSRSGSSLLGDGRVTVVIEGCLRYADGRAAAFIPIMLGARRSVTDGAGNYRFDGINLPKDKLVALVPGEGEVEVPIRDGTAQMGQEIVQEKAKRKEKQAN